MPSLTVFAGPNGAGKSTLTSQTRFEGMQNLLDADAIAKRINPKIPADAAIEAGREVLRNTRQFVEDGESFSIETTFSGSWAIAAIRVALENEFYVRLIYVGLETAELAIERVRARAARGGHDVPDDDIRRRYARSTANLRRALTLANEVDVYDNSGVEFVHLIQVRNGVVTHIPLDDFPWAQSILK